MMMGILAWILNASHFIPPELQETMNRDKSIAKAIYEGDSSKIIEIGGKTYTLRVPKRKPY